jgi:hypothetical protein
LPTDFQALSFTSPLAILIIALLLLTQSFNTRIASKRRNARIRKLIQAFVVGRLAKIIYADPVSRSVRGNGQRLCASGKPEDFYDD